MTGFIFNEWWGCVGAGRRATTVTLTYEQQNLPMWILTINIHRWAFVGLRNRCCSWVGSSRSSRSSTAAGRACCRSYAPNPNTAASRSSSPVSCSCRTDPSARDQKRNSNVQSIWLILAWSHKHYIWCSSRNYWHDRYSELIRNVMQCKSFWLPRSKAQWTGTCSGVCRTSRSCLRSGWAPSSGRGLHSKCTRGRSGHV